MISTFFFLCSRLTLDGLFFRTLRCFSKGLGHWHWSAYRSQTRSDTRAPRFRPTYCIHLYSLCQRCLRQIESSAADEVSPYRGSDTDRCFRLVSYNLFLAGLGMVPKIQQNKKACSSLLPNFSYITVRRPIYSVLSSSWCNPHSVQPRFENIINLYYLLSWPPMLPS
jgi:hypothetical protein